MPRSPIWATMSPKKMPSAYSKIAPCAYSSGLSGGKPRPTFGFALRPTYYVSLGLAGWRHAGQCQADNRTGNRHYAMLSRSQNGGLLLLALSEDSLVEDLPSLASMLAAGHCDLEPKRLCSDHYHVKRLAGTMEPYQKLTVSPISAVGH